MPILEINNLGATVQLFAPSSAGSAPNRDKDKYIVDDIKDPTQCTLMYVKGRVSRTIEGCILKVVFKSQSLDLNIKLFKLHTIY
jgi:hypothetical protein